MNHPFVDGNKRTAVTACARFLAINNYELSVSNKEIVEFVLDVVVKKMDVPAISMWLEAHSQRS